MSADGSELTSRSIFIGVERRLLRSTPVEMERIESSETSALKAQTPPGDYPKDTIRHSTRGESLKSRLKFTECIIISNMCNFHQRVIYTESFSKFTHANLQAAPVTVHISVSINHTMKNFRQFHILQIKIRFNDSCEQPFTPLSLGQ